ncbi:Endonuclease/exonuclease/phosphatase [Parasponia andersonii]|uniref:Endonuclease/exonuclease/phosphatase n=1 Tax=Parasponia andersonii TaxID=3476 RepID=A0A2P5C2G2_PARAD|nr:Endonuclease/exonuclease/phosphatase [Parasponia andersonii]
MNLPESIDCLLENKHYFFSFVYANILQTRRRLLWDNLRSIIPYGSPWLVIGDFNAVTSSHERLGSNLPLRSSCDEFVGMIDHWDLLDIGTHGFNFTRANGRGTRAHVECRLDRIIIL